MEKEATSKKAARIVAKLGPTFADPHVVTQIGLRPWLQPKNQAYPENGYVPLPEVIARAQHVVLTWSPYGRKNYASLTKETPPNFQSGSTWRPLWRITRVAKRSKRTFSNSWHMSATYSWPGPIVLPSSDST